MPVMTIDDKRIILASLGEYHRYYMTDVYRPLSDILLLTPAGVRKYSDRIKKSTYTASNKSNYPDYNDDSLSLRALIWKRKRLAAELEVPRAKTTDSDIVAALDAKVAAVDTVIRAYVRCKPCHEPSFFDYMSISSAEKSLSKDWSPPAPAYDEKFGIILSASRVESDFHYYREQCGVRGVPLGFMFVDIDDFKPYNTEHGHTKVDTDLLPQFQQALDSSVYSRGRAYRQGGDEYILLLPNADKSEVERFAQLLQERLGKVRYRLDVKSNPTVSIGYVVVLPDSTATCREVQEQVGVSLKKVKEELGKNQCHGVELDWKGPLTSSS